MSSNPRIEWHRRNILQKPTNRRNSRLQSVCRRPVIILGSSMICLVGALWQLFLVTDSYLKYEAFSEVTLEKKDFVIPPAVSLCLPYVEVIPWTSMSAETWINLSRKQQEDFTDEVQKRYTIGQLLTMTPNMTDLLLSAFTRVDNSYEITVNLADLDIMKYLRNDMICYRIMNSESGKEDFRFRSHHVTYGDHPQTLLGLSLNYSRLRHVTRSVIFMHSYQVLPRGDADFPFVLMAFNHSPVFDRTSSYVGLSYSKISMNLLRPPYSTRCYPWYNEEDWESEYHFIHSCLNNGTLRRFRQASFMTSFTDVDDDYIMPKYSVFRDKVKERRLDDMLASCMASSPGPACRYVRFVPVLFVTRESPDVTILLYDMNGPQTTVIMKGKVALVDLFVQILSITGIWMGISVVGIVSKVWSWLLVLCLGRRRP